ncbi:hypothetical protein GCM10026982_41190 [Nocardiopsis aegyptia]
MLLTIATHSPCTGAREDTIARSAWGYGGAVAGSRATDPSHGRKRAGAGTDGDGWAQATGRRRPARARFPQATVHHA